MGKEGEGEKREKKEGERMMKVGEQTKGTRRKKGKKVELRREKG